MPPSKPRDIEEFNKIASEYEKKHYPDHHLLYRISNAVFSKEVQKILPDWDVTITPDDFIPNPEKYDSVKISINNKNKKTLEATISTMGRRRPPSHFGIIVANIASLACRQTQQDELKLSQRIHDHFSRFFDERGHALNH